MEIQEGELLFSFDDEHWSDVINFDQGNIDYTRIEKLNGTKAVDFFGKHTRFGYCFIEVKNFRYHRIENKKRLDSGELFLEIGQKVKDALACITSASRNSTNQKTYWQNALTHITDQNKRLTVVLWLEENPNIFFGKSRVDQKRNKVNRNIKARTLKTQLAWLTSTVFILSSQYFDPNHWNLSVNFDTSLPD